jgi:hypothetical protein
MEKSTSYTIHIISSFFKYTNVVFIDNNGDETHVTGFYIPQKKKLMILHWYPLEKYSHLICPSMYM